MTADIESLRITELKSIIGSLRESCKNIDAETEELSALTAKGATVVGSIEDQIKTVTQDLERYRGLYQGEVKAHNEALMQIETHKRFIGPQPGVGNSKQRLSASSTRLLVRPLTSSSGRLGVQWTGANHRPQENSKTAVVRGIKSAWGGR
jgi:hypothetical protein